MLLTDKSRQKKGNTIAFVIAMILTIILLLMIILL